MKDPRHNLLRLIDAWRSQHNPLRGLTMSKAVTLLERGEQGDYADLQWLYRFVEKRDATLRALKRRLFPAISALDWNIKIPDKLGGPALRAAEAQQKTLREAYDRIDNLRAAFKALVLAEFRGYAHLEKHWVKEGDRRHVTHLEPVPQWHWLRHGGMYGDWQFNEDASAGKQQGLPVDPANFLIWEVEDPIDEIALIAFIRKGLSQKDWDGFIETYGIPWIFLILPPEARGDDFAKFQEVCDQVASDSRGTLPHGSDVKSADAGVRGQNPFKEHIDEQRQEIVLAGTGGLLTMLAEATGLGSGVADAHDDTFQKIAAALALDISEIFQDQLDKQILEARHPNEQHYAYFELAAVDEESTDAHFDRAAKAYQAGKQIDSQELSEKTGYTITDLPQNQSPQGRVFNRIRNRAGDADLPIGSDDDAFLTRGRQLLSAALGADLRPLADRIAAILRLSDTELPRALRQLSADMPQILRQAHANRATVEVFEQILGASLATGLTEDEPAST